MSEKMQSFRVKLLLNNFFDDFRSKVYVLVNPEWENIRCLQIHIVRLFQLKGKIYLTTDENILLPAFESISLISPNDTLIAYPVKTDAYKDDTDPSAIDNDSPSIQNPIKKMLNSSCLNITSQPNILANFQETPIIKQIKKKRKTYEPLQSTNTAVEMKIVENFENSSNGDLDDSTGFEITEKTKKKRKRKRKQKIFNEREESTVQQTPLPIYNSLHLRKSKLQKTPYHVITSHIRFSDDENDENEKNENADDEASNTYLAPETPIRTAETPKARIVPAVLGEGEDISFISKHETTTVNLEESSELEKITDGQSANETGMIVEDDLLNKSSDNQNETCDITSNNVQLAAGINDISALEHLRNSIDMLDIPISQEFPKKNEIIAFKLLRIAENYVPELSEFIIGMVENANEESKQLEIFILAGNDQVKEPQGKFSLPTSDETVVDDGIIHVKWDELKEIRMVPM